MDSADELTQASRVLALVRFRSALWGIVTQLLDPLNAHAHPNFPGAPFRLLANVNGDASLKAAARHLKACPSQLAR